MSKIFITVVLTLLTFLISLPAESDNMGRGMFSPPNLCGVDSKIFLNKLVKRDLPEKTIFAVLVIFGNDLQCQEPEYMANFAVIAAEGPKKYHYGVFHIHFSRQGELISAAAINEWQFINNLDDALIVNKWCNFIRSVYPKDPQNKELCN